MDIVSIESVARDLCGSDMVRNSILDGLRMRLQLCGPENGRTEYEATLRALQAMAKMRELLARLGHRSDTGGRP